MSKEKKWINYIVKKQIFVKRWVYVYTSVGLHAGSPHKMYFILWAMVKQSSKTTAKIAIRRRPHSISGFCLTPEWKRQVKGIEEEKREEMHGECQDFFGAKHLFTKQK